MELLAYYVVIYNINMCLEEESNFVDIERKEEMRNCISDYNLEGIHEYHIYISYIYVG